MAEREKPLKVFAIEDNGGDKKYWHEVGVAYVVPRDGVALNEETLRSYARQRLANYKVPKRFVLVDRLPQLPNGKFDKVALRAQARQG